MLIQYSILSSVSHYPEPWGARIKSWLEIGPKFQMSQTAQISKYVVLSFFQIIIFQIPGYESHMNRAGTDTTIFYLCEKLVPNEYRYWCSDYHKWNVIHLSANTHVNANLQNANISWYIGVVDFWSRSAWLHTTRGKIKKVFCFSFRCNFGQLTLIPCPR